jgi:hypothetical protein
MLHNVAKERWQDMGPAILRLKPGKYIPLPNGKREKTVEVMGEIFRFHIWLIRTRVKMFESAKIVEYLKKQYGQ